MMVNLKYCHTPSDKFEQEFIPNKVRLVEQKVLKILRGEKNITLMFDRNTTWKPNRCILFMQQQKSKIPTFERDWGQWSAPHGRLGLRTTFSGKMCQFSLVLTLIDLDSDTIRVVNEIEEPRNNYAGQLQVNAKYPSILDTSDCVHHIHLTIKDLSKLSEFKNASASEISFPLTPLQHFAKSLTVTAWKKRKEKKPYSLALASGW